MGKLIELDIAGIKCDMPGCDYHDNSARFEDYKNWLNRPCPKCSGNLLTQRDFEFARKFKRRVAIINLLFGWLLLFKGMWTGRARHIEIQTDGRGIPIIKDRGVVELSER